MTSTIPGLATGDGIADLANALADEIAGRVIANLRRGGVHEPEVEAEIREIALKTVTLTILKRLHEMAAEAAAEVA